MRDDGSWTILFGQAGTEAAGALLERYYAELDDRFPEGFELGTTVSADGAEVTPPNGDVLVVLDATTGEGTGVGAVKLLSSDVAEIKRMWVAPEARGRGLSRRLLAALEDRARELGALECRLDTHRSLHEALALYRSTGYRDIPAYNANPYAHHWLAKPLV